MKLGLHLGLMADTPPAGAAEKFLELAREHRLNACELHLEVSLYNAAFRPWKPDDVKTARALRDVVADLGVHLPFMDLNPVSSQPRVAESSLEALRDAVRFAATIHADYAVLHVRGRQGGSVPLDLWAGVIAELTAFADGQDLALCAENADDLPAPQALCDLLDRVPKAHACLDVGHLFERRYPESRVRRVPLLLNDRWSPAPFLVRSGLPAGRDSWETWARRLGPRLRCVHLHNHNGRLAHQPLRNGTLRFAALRCLPTLSPQATLIVEADYRWKAWTTIHADLRLLRELLS